MPNKKSVDSSSHIVYSIQSKLVQAHLPGLLLFPIPAEAVRTGQSAPPVFSLNSQYREEDTPNTFWLVNTMQILLAPNKYAQLHTIVHLYCITRSCPSFIRIHIFCQLMINRYYVDSKQRKYYDYIK